MATSPLEERVFNEMLEEEKAKSRNTGLFSEDALREKVRLQLEGIKEDVREKIGTGYLLLATLYREYNAGHPEDQKLTIPFLEPEFFLGDLLKEKSTEKLESYEECIADYFGIDSGSFEQCYMLILELFEMQKYEEAKQILFFLNFICPASPEFLNAMGHAEYNLHHFDEAASMFLIAFATDESDPEPLRHAAHCFLQMGDDESAKECHELARTYCDTEGYIL